MLVLCACPFCFLGILELRDSPHFLLNTISDILMIAFLPVLLLGLRVPRLAEYVLYSIVGIDIFIGALGGLTFRGLMFRLWITLMAALLFRSRMMDRLAKNTND